MAVETWEYRVDVDKDPAFYKKVTHQFYIRRVTNPSMDASLYRLATTGGVATGTMDYGWSAAVWNDGGPLYFGTNGSLCKTEHIPRNTTNYNLMGVKLNYISEDLLAIGSSPTLIDVSSPNTVVDDKNQRYANTVLLYNKQSIVLKVQVEPKVSVGTVENLDTNVYLGKDYTANVTQAATSDVSYKFRWVMGSYSHEASVPIGSKSVTWRVDSNWANSLSEGTTYVNGTITFTATYNGQIVAEKTSNVTYYVGNVGDPEISYVTLTRIDNTKNGYATSRGIYIQGVTGVKLTVYASVATGSTIKNYTFTTPEGTYVRTSSELEISEIKTGGTYNYTVVVEDTNGRKASYTNSFYVYSYNKPSLSSPTAMRCSRTYNTQTGNYDYIADGEGSYAVVKASVNVSQIGTETNVGSIRCSIRESTSSTYSTYYSLQSNVNAQIKSDLKSAETTQYYVVFQVSDSITNWSSAYEVMLSSASYSIHVRNGGMGVAIGQMSDGNSQFQIADDWTPKWGTYVMPRIIYYDPISDTDQPTKKAGLIWLKPKK